MLSKKMLVGGLLLTASLCLVGYSQADAQEPGDKAVFTYDETALPDAKPWTSGNFRNDPGNFQFVIIGDRSGGANIEGTFNLAMEQLNLLQPEFVINVGDLIEGYSDVEEELTGEWDCLLYTSPSPRDS